MGQFPNGVNDRNISVFVYRQITPGPQELLHFFDITSKPVLKQQQQTIPCKTRTKNI